MATARIAQDFYRPRAADQAMWLARCCPHFSVAGFVFFGPRLYFIACSFSVFRREQRTKGACALSELLTRFREFQWLAMEVAASDDTGEPQRPCPI
jgi:hypothetical protein